MPSTSNPAPDEGSSPLADAAAWSSTCQQRLSRKRKHSNSDKPPKMSVNPGKKMKASDRPKPSPPKEKRLRRHRASPPASFDAVYQRALSQRFYVLQRSRHCTNACPSETFEVAGSTGNIYAVQISQELTCSCPHAVKDNHCKHIIYILGRVLQAPFHHIYQRALLSSELVEIFAKAPGQSTTEQKTQGERKSIEDDCPICFCSFDSETPESIVWCRAACGQNIHQECFETWAKTKSGDVTCPFCRSVWEGDPEMVSRVEKSRGIVREGYVNVAEQLGISTERDHSTYSSWFNRPTWGVRRNYRHRHNRW